MSNTVDLGELGTFEETEAPKGYEGLSIKHETVTISKMESTFDVKVTIKVNGANKAKLGVRLTFWLARIFGIEITEVNTVLEEV